MFRYILVLLSINASYRSLGNPITQSTPVTLANSLTALANDCENAFLSNQIKAKLLDCSTIPPSHNENQLQCLIFLDINKQLCAAVSAGKIAIREDVYTDKINVNQDVNSLCLLAKEWAFSNLTGFSRYQQAVDKVFKHTVTCARICGVEDILSEDANFYCKYFKWGSDILKQPTGTTTQNVQNPSEQEAVNVDKDESALANSDLDVQIKETSSTNAKVDTQVNAQESEAQPKADLPKPETNSQVAIPKTQSVDPGTVVNVGAVPDIQANVDTAADNVEDTGAMPDNNLEDQSNKSTEKVAPKLETVQESGAKPKAEEAQSKLEDAPKIEENKELQQLNNELEHKPVLETPNGKVPPGDVDDYPDSEEGKEGLSDIQGGDDGDDQLLGDLPSEDQKPVPKAETPVSTFTREKESFYPAQEAFPEDDDHFFSFFLTAIVLVVLLYVLYHNKNKVGKVFFGLMVEGRAARRRGSRGHAYRRLDTLEQAMSAASAAPPSKIIY